MFKIIVLLLLILALGLGGWWFFVNRNIYTPSISQNKTTPNKQIRIGIISQKSNPTYETSVQSMKKELEDKKYPIGYIQDPITDTSDYQKVAEHYAAMGVDLIVTNSTPATVAALKATSSIPIIFGSVGDPVNNKVVNNLDSSGNNATGISSLSVDLTPVRLGFLKKINPYLRRVYIVEQPGETNSDNSLPRTIKEAKSLGINLIQKSATNSGEVAGVAFEIKSSEAQAIMMAASSMVWANVKYLIEAQNREKIPVIGVDRTSAESGAVLSYGPDYSVMGQQLAELVEQVLKGVKPQYIPIQRPKKIELVINKKAAGNIGLEIPDDLSKQADLIIP